MSKATHTSDGIIRRAQKYADSHRYVLVWPTPNDLVDAFIAGAQAMREISDETGL